MSTPNPTYDSGVVTATATAALAVTIPPGTNVILTNLSTAYDVFVGGQGVTTDETATGGKILPKAVGTFPDFTSSTPVTIPAPAGQPTDLWAVCPTGGTALVQYLFS
jgi:hypothetical protein